MNKAISTCVLSAVLICLCSISSHAADANPNPKDDGYRGVWFALGTRRTINKYGDKYSGGLGTYTANHVPMAIYAKKANKTFFVFGGAKHGKTPLLAMISYYDHERNVVPRPTIVHDWETADPAIREQGVNDPHDNPSLCIDGDGHIWVFVSGRGSFRSGVVYRSTEPYSIERFELIRVWDMTYPQSWWIEGKGFLHLFTKYTAGRELYWIASRNGRRWGNDHRFAGFGGHYQTSTQVGNSVITAFNMHPDGVGDRRTNLYYIRTDDAGRTWKNYLGESVKTPLDRIHNPALVRDYQSENRLVYIHDLNLDRQGHPLILYTTSAYHEAGPRGDPRWWTVAHWNGTDWNYTEVTRANHNYTTGSIYVEDDLWRIIGPTEPGPQPLGCGGEVAVWTSRDEGKTWHKDRDVTHGSEFNHTYVRRPLHAHPDFHAFWADGDTVNFSKSHFYFCDKTGEHVRRLPYDMKKEFAEPELIVPTRPTM